MYTTYFISHENETNFCDVTVALTVDLHTYARKYCITVDCN